MYEKSLQLLRYWNIRDCELSAYPIMNWLLISCQIFDAALWTTTTNFKKEDSPQYFAEYGCQGLGI